jgi:hypothetical protein
LTVDSETLARELADRMNDVVPPGITIAVEGDLLVFQSDFDTGRAGSYASRWLNEGAGTLAERVREACRLAFSDLQDFVDEETTQPWPGLRTPPEAQTRLERGSVVIWFGDPGAPDLTIAPLLLEGR